MKVDIRQEMALAIQRSGQTKSKIARELNTTPSNVTNWLEPERPLPLYRLVDLANYLGDVQLMFKIFEYEFGMSIVSSRRLRDNTPSSWLSAALKEERDRHDWENKADQILLDRPDEVDKQEFETVKRFDKELLEEIGSENELHVVIRNWINDTKEAVANGTGYEPLQNHISDGRWNNL